MSTPVALLPARSAARAARPVALAVALLAGGVLAAAHPAVAFGALVALALMAVAFLRPPIGAYILLAATPLIAGMNRGTAIPLLRPSEAANLLVLVAVGSRWLLEVISGRAGHWRPRATDAALAALMVTGSALPLGWLWARSQPLTQENVLYSFQILNFLGAYLVVRMSIRTDAQVRRCLHICVGVGAVVAAVGVLQALKLFGVPELLASHWTVNGQADLLVINRASSTVSDSFAMADLMIFDLAIVVALMLRRPTRRRWLVAAGALFVVAGLASGEASGAIGLLVGVTTLGWLTGRVKRAIVALMVAVVLALAALGPVVHQRLSPSSGNSFQSSWQSRVHNLETYVIPPLAAHASYVLGVHPEARIPVTSGPDRGDVIYIESGYLWLLWIGGIPYLVAFIAFIRAHLRATRRAARRGDAIGAAATAAFAALAVEAVLMVFDPHMTLRGAGDLFFALLALACAARSAPATLVPAVSTAEDGAGRGDHTGGQQRGLERPALPVTASWRAESTLAALSRPARGRRPGWRRPAGEGPVRAAEPAGRVEEGPRMAAAGAALLPVLVGEEWIRRHGSMDRAVLDRGEALRAALQWLSLAHDTTGRRGCSKGFSLLSGWQPAYPETTGYIIGTMIAYAGVSGDSSYLGRAVEMGDWELEMQAPDGGIRGGPVGRRSRPTLVFDTGMVIHGWLDLHEYRPAGRYIEAACRAGRYLVGQQSDDGAWRGPHSYRGTPHTYHARVSWALLRLGKVTGDQAYTAAAMANLGWVLSRQRTSGWFDACSFVPGALPNTHGLAYTLRGLTEAYGLVGDPRFLEAAMRTSKALIDKMETLGTLPATFDESWRPAATSVCLTGLAQLGALWLRLWQLTGHQEPLLRAGARAVDQATGRQRRLGWPPLRGALAGSFPLYGRYAPLLYPNWAVKFLADGLMLRAQCHAGQ